MKKKLKGFTLVELLAVIVILAIIMLIAIPAILDSLESARKKTFIEFATKTYDSSIKVRLDEELNNSALQSCVIYNIKSDLNLSNTGDYNGYVLYTNINNVPKYYIVLYDKNYIIGPALYNDKNFNISKLRRYNNESDDNLKSALALEGECINYTNKGDGSSNSSIPENGISKKLKVNDYVHYYPTVTSYTFDDKLTGCAETDECGIETINPSTAVLWRVTSINSDGTVTIVGKSSELIKLWGITGYQNGVYVLNEAASKFNDNRFAKSVKALGYNGQEDKLSDEDMQALRDNRTNKYNSMAAIKNHAKSEDSSISFQDLKDYEYTVRLFLNNTFIAGRDSSSSDWWAQYICVRRVWMNGNIMFTSCASSYPGRYPLFGSIPSCHPGSVEGDYECRFMDSHYIQEGYNKGYVGVIVTLKANVKVASGNGTQADPYELTF